ncbi:MAG: hypothetical protein B6D56_07445 [Candidatus Omnitrophica bacterium 4484_70.1]|nr:MAG: hypothetical protein B6D56_07445 [Candidatus Omnitrophica bacterium 4484_70.1]
MNTYQINLRLNSPFITPFYADTIFGHLCWMVKYWEGDKELEKFLEYFKKDQPPFIISDGFPEGYLPKPISLEFNISDPLQRKKVKKIQWVKISDFEKIRKGENVSFLNEENVLLSKLHVYNVINRSTNTTLEGGVYAISEIVVDRISIYLKTVNEEWKNKVINLLKELSRIGYGRKKSIGKGQFCVESVQEFNFSSLESADGFVTLSNFCPKSTDPTEGIYRTFVKYGKLGEEFTFCGNPFKKPLLMIKTGSVFKTKGPPKEYYGRIIQENISPVKSEVIHYAYAFSLPVSYPKNV